MRNPKNDAGLLAELEDVIRTMPPRASLRHETEENFAWLGRVAAVIEAWSLPKTILLSDALNQFQGRNAHDAQEAFRKLMTLLHQAQSDLRMKTVGPMSVAVDQGGVYVYFEEIRKIVEAATEDILFVDAYLDAEFVARYLPLVRDGVEVRLLTREKLSNLLPAVEAFVQQYNFSVAVRSTQGLHDRYVIVDGAACYQSGASFKDGARKAPTTLTQINDAFAAVRATYEAAWTAARVER